MDATADTVQTISSGGGICSALPADLSQKGAGRALFADCEAESGQLHVLVINASAQINAPLAELTDDGLTFQLNVNLRSTIEPLRSSLPRMAQRGWCRIVRIGAINQFDPKPIVTVYAATKAAQHNLIQSQARAYAQTSVTLTTLAPGQIDTDRYAERKSSGADSWASCLVNVNWMGRAGHVDEMAGAALFLSTDANSFMTCEVLSLSGVC